jgi:two-component system, OmpR family, response regulator PhoP
MSVPVVAIIEDHSSLRFELEALFREDGLEAWSADSAERFYKKLHANPADVVVVDIGLPGEDGISLVEYLKDLDRCGIVIVSGRTKLQDRLDGLRAGADLYFTKPFDDTELLLSVKRLAHRVIARNAAAQPLVAGASGRWSIDLSGAELVCPDGRRVDLTSREMELMQAVMAASNQVLARKEIMAAIGVESEEDSHRIDSLIYRLRKKVRDETGLKLPLRSVFGRGVSFANE